MRWWMLGVFASLLLAGCAGLTDGKSQVEQLVITETVTVTKTITRTVSEGPDGDFGFRFVPDWNGGAPRIVVADVPSPTVQWSRLSVEGCDEIVGDEYVYPTDLLRQCHAAATIRIWLEPEQWLLFSYSFLEEDDASQGEDAPELSFSKDASQGSLTVVKAATPAAYWSEFAVTGCDTVAGSSTTVTAGDRLQDCHGTVTIVHTPTNTLIYETSFA